MFLSRLADCNVTSRGDKSSADSRSDQGGRVTGQAALLLRVAERQLDPWLDLLNRPPTNMAASAGDLEGGLFPKPLVKP